VPSSPDPRVRSRRVGARLAGLAVVGLALLGGMLVWQSQGPRLGAVAASPPPPSASTSAPPGAAPRVMVVGDSLTFGAWRQLEESLAVDGWAPAVRGDVGYTVAHQMDLLRAVGEARPEAVVIALGTNDAFAVTDRRQTLSTTRADIDAALDAVADVPCVVWVDVTSHGPAATWRADTQRINAMIESAVAARPGASVAHWDALSVDRWEWFTADAVHHTAEGADAFADLIAASVMACPT
jgi:lysophospholipase L1-like esterase